jgi:hypothetical protein
MFVAALRTHGIGLCTMRLPYQVDRIDASGRLVELTQLQT